jgi:hypothetical protein
MVGVCRLVRLENSSTYGTFGVLTLNNQVFCVTLEPPDKENKSNISSIPVGQYTCERYASPTYGDTWEVQDVTERFNILFHAGNFMKNTKGCILLAEKFGKLYGSRAVLNSGETFRTFMKATAKHTALSLTITEAY